MIKPKKVLILSDSFKESISSKQISLIAERVFSPFIECLPYSIADGGEGTVDFYINELHYQRLDIKSCNAFLEPIDTYFAYYNDTAVFDSAQIVGFSVNNKLDILSATTYGIGIVLKKIIKLGFKKIIIGLGGSITNDGGSGLLEALGAKFYYNEKLIELHKTPFKTVNKVDLSEIFELLKEIKINILCDVINPLFGPTGATFTFSKQKGATLANQLMMEEWMIKYAKIEGFKDLSSNLGTGAAGGLGFALSEIGGTLNSGIDALLDAIHFDDLIDDKTLIVTGEGKFDETSLNGKVVGKIINRTNNKNVLIICGIDKINNPQYLTYPLHKEITTNYKETVELDLEKAFKKILKDFIIDYNLVEIKEVAKNNQSYRHLRYEVFVVEQKVDAETEFDEFEDSTKHYLFKYNNLPIGTFRLRKVDGFIKLERFLIKKEYRNLDFGLIMLKKALEIIKEKGYKLCLIHAQIRAQAFYEKCGFIPFGERFMEAEIEHISMKIEL